MSELYPLPKQAPLLTVFTERRNADFETCAGSFWSQRMVSALHTRSPRLKSFSWRTSERMSDNSSSVAQHGRSWFALWLSLLRKRSTSPPRSTNATDQPRTPPSRFLGLECPYSTSLPASYWSLRSISTHGICRSFEGSLKRLRKTCGPCQCLLTGVSRSSQI